MKRLIVYDLDGTLVDTLADITDAANHMLTQLQAPRVSAQEVRGYIGRGVRELVARCLKTPDAARIERGIRTYLAYYGQHLLDRSQLYPGALLVLEYFKDRKQAVITNKPNPFSRKLLDALGVSRYLCALIAGNSAHPKKPDPASLLALMGTLGVSAADTLLIGDSPVDIETGQRAGGVFTVSLTHGLADEDELAEACPDALVRNFQELLELAKQQQW